MIVGTQIVGRLQVLRFGRLAVLAAFQQNDAMAFIGKFERRDDTDGPAADDANIRRKFSHSCESGAFVNHALRPIAGRRWGYRTTYRILVYARSLGLDLVLDLLPFPMKCWVAGQRKSHDRIEVRSIGISSRQRKGCAMGTERLTAFSDGVIAIIITIMVLELKVPHSNDWETLQALVPVLLSYVLSFIYVAIYWNNHHHLFHASTRVNGSILWANNHLLFWLSLIPFATGWMGENHFAPLPTAIYGVSLLMPAVAYNILQRTITRHDAASPLADALGSDYKGKLSPVFYLIAIALAFWSPWIAIAIYALVAGLWLVPDRRIESALRATTAAPPKE